MKVLVITAMATSHGFTSLNEREVPRPNVCVAVAIACEVFCDAMKRRQDIGIKEPAVPGCAYMS
jgi:hypothetical protein